MGTLSAVFKAGLSHSWFVSFSRRDAFFVKHWQKMVKLKLKLELLNFTKVELSRLLLQNRRRCWGFSFKNSEGRKPTRGTGCNSNVRSEVLVLLKITS